MIKSYKFITIIFLFILLNLSVNGASFDCNKARTFVEHTICDDKTISELDDKLLKVYNQAKDKYEDENLLKKEERAWLKNKRNLCKKTSCLKKVYTDRINELNDIITSNTIECKEDGTQSEMNQCSYEMYQEAREKLNIIYKKLQLAHKGDKKFLKNLRMSQKAWIKYRDTQINAEFTCNEKDLSFCFGTMYPMRLNGSKTLLTEQRIEVLKNILEDIYQ